MSDSTKSTFIDDLDFVPALLLVPPPTGSCHFSKLSAELILAIAEYLDTATCLTFSQTCRMIYDISEERVGYWNSAQFAYGIFPRVTARSNLTAKELRSTAVKSTNTAWIWESSLPRVRRRVTLSSPCSKEKCFLPSGSRWLFQYGEPIGTDSSGSVAQIYDLVGDYKIMPVIELHPSLAIDKLAGESLAADKVVFAAQFEPSTPTLIKVMVADFESSRGKFNVSVSEAYHLSMEQPIEDIVLQEGILAVVTAKTVTLQRWDQPASRRETEGDWSWRPRGCRVARNRLIVCEEYLGIGELRNCRIAIYDISSVVGGIDYSDKEKHERVLYPISVSGMTGYPLLPFSAPYQADRLSRELQFSTLVFTHDSLNKGPHLWKCEFRVLIANHQDEDEDTSKESVNHLVVGTPNILGYTDDGDPQNSPRFPDSCIIGNSSARIIWATSSGELRIYSTWTEDYSWRSRPIDFGRPMSVPQLLAFDEQLGVVVLSERSGQFTVLWFV